MSKMTSVDNPLDSVPLAHPYSPEFPSQPKIYSAGTLRYTTMGLARLFFWLLWGDFCFTVFINVYTNFLPLYLKGLHASNTVIALLATGIGGLMNLVFLPNISMWTDRYRSRWGRRIPFLLWSTPVAVLTVVGVGYSPEMAAGLRHLIGPLQVFSLTGFTLALIAFFAVGQNLSQMTTNNVYQFLLRDVVPQSAMVWFLALFRLVGLTAGCLFQWFIFRYILTYAKLICTGMGVLYLLSFLAICWGVKEGQYPPPAPAQQRSSKGRCKSYWRYFQECLSVPIYRNYIWVWTLYITGTAATAPFLLLFGTKTLGLSMTDYGRMVFWGTLVSGMVYLPVGYLCQRCHPLRVAFGSIALMLVVSTLAYFFVFNGTGWLAFSVAIALPTVGWALSSLAVTMMLFPAEEFGKFSSSLMTLGYGSLVVTSYGVGRLMDFFHSDYRIVLVVSMACYALALVPMAKVYRGWKKHGGPDHYVPPLPRREETYG